MHTRHLTELIGQDEPVSGLTVRGYGKPFDFEYQVKKHLEMMLRQWPNLDEKEEEDEIRLHLAVGGAWLHYDERFDGVGHVSEPMHGEQTRVERWTQASLFEGFDN